MSDQANHRTDEQGIMNSEGAQPPNVVYIQWFDGQGRELPGKNKTFTTERKFKEDVEYRRVVVGLCGPAAPDFFKEGPFTITFADNTQMQLVSIEAVKEAFSGHATMDQHQIRIALEGLGIKE